MLHPAGQYAPLKSPHKNRRPRRIQHWRSLPSLSEPAAIAPMVARQASSTATNPGMDAPRPVTFSRRRAETCATSKPTVSARNTDYLLAGTALPSGDIAPACSQGASWPGRSFRSPNSSDQDIGDSPCRPQCAETHDTSKPTLSAPRPIISLVGSPWKSGGIAK